MKRGALAIKPADGAFDPRGILLNDPHREADLIANAPKFHGITL